MARGWIGVDLDGTLAVYDKWRGKNHIGEPVPAMVNRIKDWQSKGIEVRIFTARMEDPSSEVYIKEWLYKNGLENIKVTNVKDMSMIELWDDKAVRVEKNTGRRIK